MLKWTVMARRDSEKPEQERHLGEEFGRKSTTPRQSKSKRRRSSTSRRSSIRKNSLDVDKENQFTSTPIKAAEGFVQFDPLRDVGNLTPKDKGITEKKSKSDKKSRLRTPRASPKLHKKKKQCLSNHSKDVFIADADSQCSNFFRPFETVDSHIEGVLQDPCSCPKNFIPDTYAPTLPTFAMDYSPCTMRTTHCLITLNNTNPKATPLSKILKQEFSPSKKAKIDHVNDFLHQISFITSPEERLNLNLPGLKQPNTKREIKVTPLVKKFIDLKFNKLQQVQQGPNDSSYLDDMSLDQIVDAILDTSETSQKKSSPNTSVLVNIDQESQQENDLNETHEENILNIESERQQIFSKRPSFDGSSDSGFRSSTTENSHQLDNNFLCKCNNNNKASSNIMCDKTIININETFNERCVDDVRPRKRASSTPIDCEGAGKRKHFDQSDDNLEQFTLKRQKCIRRRRTEDDIKRGTVEKAKKLITKVSTENLSTINNIDDDSFNYLTMESTPVLREQDSEGYNRKIRKCLFDSLRLEDSSCISESPSTRSIQDVKGSLDLSIAKEEEALLVHVIRCKDLHRPNGKQINAYVKAAISDRLGDSRRKRSGVLQRTAVQADSNRPQFNHTFKFPVLKEDAQKRIHIEVWHRDRSSRTSELLGCMSFDFRDACEKGFSGSYRLLPQSSGRSQNVPITSDTSGLSKTLVENGHPPKMCESQSSVEEPIDLELVENDLKKSNNKTALIEQQKYADENLFLRYLELDPTEGPEAIPAATQRKATGNKSGRTPFTHTKKLTRPAKSGFGFSVVWTHPPRIERVEKGLPADKAGILPGDYIIFVDKHNVVMMPEIDILNLIRSYGSQLTLEIFRRNPSRNGSVPSVKRLISSTTTSATTTSHTTTMNSGLPVAPVAPLAPSVASSNLVQRRPSTVCSTNTTSMDYHRRKLHLPQITFTSEKPTSNPEENRRKTMYQLVNKEQVYATGLQFAITRFVSALAERKDLISPGEHRILFQNIEDILRITEDIIDSLVQDDGEIQIQMLVRTYQMKLGEITSAYKRYCSGIKKADCILANKTKNCNSDFVKFLQVPVVPRRRPDITTFIHKPLEHYRDVLKSLMVIQSLTKPLHEDYPVINQIVHDLQSTYREMTSEAGLMEPVGGGRPLLTVQDLENRLVFTKCKPFVLNKPGRQWIFGGDLCRVEGKNVRNYWTLLFSDLLLFAKVSRDRVLFVMEDPLPLAQVSDIFFNVRKKDTEFRITVHPDGKKASSPTVHCGPDLTRTPRKNANKRTVILRAPTTEMKAVWQNLLQRQIFHVNSGMDGSSFSSPLESPDAPITSSVATLQSAESLSFRRQTPQNINQKNENQKELDELIEQKCKQLSKNCFNNKCNTLHLEKWMKGQLNSDIDPPDLEPLDEEWTAEMLRKRSQELQLIDQEGNLKIALTETRNGKNEETLSDPERSPSKSTESPVTVRSSPLVPETVQVCRNCHKNCLANGNVKNFETCEDKKQDNGWQSLVLLGFCASNPAANLISNLDPFSFPSENNIPKISVLPATPASSIKADGDDPCKCQHPTTLSNLEFNSFDASPDDSPQSEEPPYHSLSSSVATLRRFGTVSSLEFVGSEDQEPEENMDNHISSGSDSDDYDKGIDNEAFNHSSILNWTVRAGSYVAEKMAFFEKLSEDCRSSGKFFERYLKTAEITVNGEETQEEETSGATSGEEIWGTPTSGGELDDSLTSPNLEGKQSPNDGSISSDNDDTEMMMDELLMTPPMTGAIMRGLLPRRTLEPLIEEDFSESSSDVTTPTEPSGSPEQGKEIGGAADIYLSAAASPIQEAIQGTDTSTLEAQEVGYSSAMDSVPVSTIRRSESYRRFLEIVESEPAENDICFFNRFKPTAKFTNCRRIPRTRSIKIFEFLNLNIRRQERRIYESYPEGAHLIKLFNREVEVSEEASSYSQNSLGVKRLKDKQVDGRFWRQLSRRRQNKTNLPT